MNFHIREYTYRKENKSLNLNINIFNKIHLLDNSGAVMSVSIHHQVTKGTPQNYVQNCPEIVECLKNQDFDLFIKHLEVRKYTFIYMKIKELKNP